MSVWFHAIGPDRWRVMDLLHPRDDVRSLLGFVERREGTYELTRLGRPRRPTGHDSLDAVREALRADLGDVER